MDRRQALCSVGVGLLGLYGCARLPTFQAALTQGGFELKRSDIDEALLAEGGVRVRAVDLSEDIALMQHDDGILQALGMTCSHLGCQVRPGGGFLVCPCHGSTFDLRGEVVRGPAQRALNRYIVTEKNGRITIYASTR